MVLFFYMDPELSRHPAYFSISPNAIDMMKIWPTAADKKSKGCLPQETEEGGPSIYTLVHRVPGVFKCNEKEPVNYKNLEAQ